jgi:NAD(P)-dependent dehydrogenase (short-subunit alcohol dehydrogenase family)
MKGKHVAITGATAGIGRHTALELAAQGAELTLFFRNADKGQSIQQDCLAISGREPTLIPMDMANLASVRQAGAEFLALQKPLDVLLNNAGLVNTSRRETVDGFEETLAVNHFAPFLLTGLLMPAIQEAPSARIVNVASHAHTFVKSMGFEDMQAERSYKTFREYGRSKLANILFTRSLARRLDGQDITVNCLHPGAVSTSLGQNNPGLLTKVLPLLLKPFFRSPEQGAETSIYLCCSDDVAGVSGEYFSNCRPGKAKPWAKDDAAAEQLWQYSQTCTDFTYPV